MDSTNLCNALRMEFEGVFESKIPLDAFPAKIQDMILALARQENYSIEYMMASLLVAVSTAIGNAVNIRIRGGWISNPALYMILVGRPGMGKTPPLDFAFRPIRKHDAKIIKQFKLDMEHYNSLIENNKVKKDKSSSLPDKPVLRRIIISDFTPEALMRALDDNQRGVVVYVDEIMGMFNAVNQYSKGQLIEQLLTAFSGKPLDISRCSIPVPIHIEHPFINIVGTMQTTRMHELIEKGYKIYLKKQERNVENMEENNVENEEVKEIEEGNNGIKIANDVISVIAGVAVSEVPGVASMAGGFAGGITEVLSGKKNLSKGIKVDADEKEVRIDVNIIVEYGSRIPDVAYEIQTRVKKSVENMTGLKVSEVNVHVQGVKTEKEVEEKEENEEVIEEQQ